MLGLKNNADNLELLGGLCAISRCENDATQIFVSTDRELSVCLFHLDVLEKGLSLW